MKKLKEFTLYNMKKWDLVRHVLECQEENDRLELANRDTYNTSQELLAEKQIEIDKQEKIKKDAIEFIDRYLKTNLDLFDTADLLTTIKKILKEEIRK